MLSTTASASCADRFAKAGCALMLAALTGCASPEPPPRTASATALLEERFPNRARTLREDDGRWLADWLATQWPAHVESAALRRELDEQRMAGNLIEESLLAALPRFGLWAHAGYGTKPELLARLQAGTPVVVQLSMPAGNRRARRFAVVLEYIPAERAVRGLFPNGATLLLEEENFLAAWGRYRNWMLTACPPERATWPMRSPERASLIRYNDHIGRSDAGDALAAQALAADPRNADLAAALGTRALQRGRVSEAEELFRRALAENDRHVSAANNLAYLLGQQGRVTEEALALSRRAMLLEPANPRILHTHGFLLGQTGEWAEARATLERAWQWAQLLPVEARSQVGVSLMRAYLRTDTPHLACDVLRVLRKADPGLMLPEDVQAPLDLAGDCR